MPGIGPKTAERLASLGIRTLGELAALDDVTAAEVLGSHGAGIVARARGVDIRAVHENDPVKSVSNERTFASDVRTPDEVDGALAALSAKVGQRVRSKGLSGRTITVKMRFSDFTTKTVRRTLEVASDDESVFGAVARELVRQGWSPGVGLRLLGVGLSGFDEKAVQLGFLDECGSVQTRAVDGSASGSRGAGDLRPSGRTPREELVRRARRGFARSRSRGRSVRARTEVTDASTRRDPASRRRRAARLRYLGRQGSGRTALTPPCRARRAAPRRARCLGRRRPPSPRRRALSRAALAASAASQLSSSGAPAPPSAGPMGPFGDAAAQPDPVAVSGAHDIGPHRVRDDGPGPARSCSAACRRRGRRDA